MKIKFLGATGEVTGSCTWCILDNGVQFLVDCGMFQGWGEEYKNPDFAFDPAQIKFVLLTHAHADHCGRIPLLYKQGFKGKVYCTTATKNLTRLNLKTIAKENEYFNEGDVNKIQFVPYDEHKKGFSKPIKISVANGFFVNFQRTSHMLGSAAISVAWRTDKNEPKQIFFSGDVGNNREGNCYQPLLKANYTANKSTDYFVLESTYGAKKSKEPKFKDSVARINALNDIISDDRYDEVIIPCFSIQRTQDLLFDLFCTLAYCFPPEEKVLVVVDSPTGREACKFFKQHLLLITNNNNCYLSKKCAETLGTHFGEEIDAHTVVSEMMAMLLDKRDYSSAYDNGKNFDIRPAVKEWKEELAYQETFDKKIFITSSGMCHAGPVLDHLPKLTDENAAFVLTGYQGTDEGRFIQRCVGKEKFAAGGKKSVGSLDLKDGGALDIEDVNADVYHLGDYYSGHADKENLLHFLFENEEEKGRPGPDEELKSVTVFLNHGDDGARHGLKKAIEERSEWGREPNDMRQLGQVIIPSDGDNFYDLNKNEWVSDAGEMIQNQRIILKQLSALQGAVAASSHAPTKYKKQKGKSAKATVADKTKQETTS